MYSVKLVESNLNIYINYILFLFVRKNFSIIKSLSFVLVTKKLFFKHMFSYIFKPMEKISISMFFFWSLVFWFSLKIQCENLHHQWKCLVAVGLLISFEIDFYVSIYKFTSGPLRYIEQKTGDVTTMFRFNLTKDFPKYLKVRIYYEYLKYNS